jgi:AcrR family transcriptional regulator
MAKTTEEPEVTQDRRLRIVEVAAEFFAQSSISATTVREIGEAAGILSGSLYHYFPSKDAIVDEIMVSFLNDLTERYAEVLKDKSGAIEQLRGLVHASLESTATHMHAAEIYQNDVNYILNSPRFGHVQEKANEVRTVWLKVLDAGVSSGTLRSDVPTWLVYHLLRDSIWLTVRWFKSSDKYDYAALAEDCCRIFLRGFVAPGIDLDFLEVKADGRSRSNSH